MFAAVGTNVNRLVTNGAPPTASSNFLSRKFCVNVIRSIACPAPHIQSAMKIV